MAARRSSKGVHVSISNYRFDDRKNGAKNVDNYTIDFKAAAETDNVDLLIG